jgi:ribonuclease HI
MADTPVATGAVLYTDGGFLADKRIGGWGVHGYTFIDEAPKKGTGNPKAVPSDKGYLGDNIVGNKVTPIEYIDLIGGRRDYGSNNEVELEAMYRALLWLQENPEIIKAVLLSDSMFVVKGTDFLPAWAEGGKWLNKKGGPIKYRPLWEKYKEVWDDLRSKISIEMNHVKAHNGEMGNTIADSHAGRGLVLGTKKDDTIIRDRKVAQGYWGNKNVIPRILQAPRWYFATNDLEYKRADGTTVYYVGSHGTKDKEDELYGKPYADNFLGVVRVKEPDPVMETLRLTAIAKDAKQYGAIVIAHLDAIFSPKTYKELSDYNTTFLYPSKKGVDLLDSKDVPVLVEMRPAGLGFRGVQSWDGMSRVLDGVLEGDDYYVLTDITDLLYEEKGDKKVVRKLKPSISQIVKYLDVGVTFNLEKAKDEPKPFIGKVRLVLGGDILTRNQLAALAEDVKSVKVVCWRESDNVGRYATMVELLSGDVGIWARTASNIYYHTIKQKTN